VRRIPLTLAVTTALLPLVYSLSAAPAMAAGSSLTITTIGRNGKAVTGNQATVVNLSSSQSFTAQSGHALSLPSGRYAVITDIETTAPGTEWGMTDTLGTALVNVSGGSRVTLDARQGKAVKVSLNTPAGGGFQTRIDARACLPGYGAVNVEAYNSPGELFEIPDSSRDFSMSWIQSWLGSNSDYLLSGVAPTLPSNPSYAYSRAKLAYEYIRVDKGEDLTNNAALTLQPEPANDPGLCGTDLWAGEFQNQSAPYGTEVYTSPGQWIARTDVTGNGGDIGGGFTQPLTMQAGKTYYQTFGRAAWGPVNELPTVSYGRIDLYLGDLIGDVNEGTGETADFKYWASLHRSGKVLKSVAQQTYGNDNSEFDASIGSAGWYDLNTAAERYRPGQPVPAGTLSTSVFLNFHFYARPNESQVTQSFLTHFTPMGLNSANQAAPGASTPVSITLFRSSGGSGLSVPSETIKSLTVMESANGGKTWKAVAAKRSGNTWSANVTDPAGGYVSLRTVIVDTAGNSTDEQIDNAYGIS